MSDEAKNIFGRRLHQARTMQGLSLRALADKIGATVSHTALAKFENGELEPNSTVLIALANALGQASDFFFRPFTLHLQNIEFRKRASLGSKAEEAIKEQALEFFERYHEIEELLGESRPFAGKLDFPPLKTSEDAEGAANKLRTDWKLGRDPLPNLVELLESKGVRVYEPDVPEDAFDGFSADTKVGPVVVIRRGLNKNLLRKRMTTVHELAHIVLSLDRSVTGTKEREAIAARFAGAFLLPKETFIGEFGKMRNGISLGELIELKVNFGASIWAIMMRARQLGLISEAIFLRFCKEAAPWRSAKEEPGDELYRGNESHSRFRQLVHRAVAEDQVSMSKGAALLNQSLGELRKELRSVYA
ncbi:MAG: XRE family transcriptional regulator [Verrucomicrobia subdivision 3 bacterium]|nr:XRE family transcriptional regulator [Limisphaerales bacterium]